MTARLDFKQSLKEAKAEFAALQEEIGECMARQEELEKNLAAVRLAITGFSSALGEAFDEADELGFTDAVRQAFKTYDKPLEPTAVRTRLRDLGFNTNKYGNFMAALHTVISRLLRQGEIKQHSLPGNKVAYTWSQPAGALGKLSDMK